MNTRHLAALPAFLWLPLLTYLVAAWNPLFHPAYERAWPVVGANPGEHARRARAEEVDRRFTQAVAMLHARRYEEAVAALHRVLELAPRMPEAHVNMGFALYGLEQPGAALDFFRSAVELRPEQVNAYYGMALSAEALGQLPEALGAMRTYIHLSPPDDPYLRKARSALWEWEARLPGSGKHEAQVPGIRKDSAGDTAR